MRRYSHGCLFFSIRKGKKSWRNNGYRSQLESTIGIDFVRCKIAGVTNAAPAQTRMRPRGGGREKRRDICIRAIYVCIRSSFLKPVPGGRSGTLLYDPCRFAKVSYIVNRACESVFSRPFERFSAIFERLSGAVSTSALLPPPLLAKRSSGKLR